MTSYHVISTADRMSSVVNGHPVVAKTCLKCWEALMNVAKQSRSMAVSSACSNSVPLTTFRNNGRSPACVIVLDIPRNMFATSWTPQQNDADICVCGSKLTPTHNFQILLGWKTGWIFSSSEVLAFKLCIFCLGLVLRVVNTASHVALLSHPTVYVYCVMHRYCYNMGK